MLHLITQKDIDKAIKYLTEKLSEDLLIQIYLEMKTEPNDKPFHCGLKNSVKKHLQNSKFKWNDAVIDDLWKKLVSEAARKNYKGAK